MANHYVRAGAGGANNGSDWANAYTDLPATFVRGDTYYVADGTYPAQTFDTVVSGTTRIFIKKAIESDHGTDTGWSSAYGDGQAAFTALSFKTDDWTFDGQVRNEENWFDSGAYGFKVGTGGSQNYQITIINNANTPDDITLKYIYCQARETLAVENTGPRTIQTDNTAGTSTADRILIHRVLTTAGCNTFFLRRSEDAIVEYCAHTGGLSNTNNHGETGNLYYSGHNATFRYNQFTNMNGTAVVAQVNHTGQSTGDADGIKFYGNICWLHGGSDGAVGFNSTTRGSSHNRVFNNTFVQGDGGNSGIQFGTGSDNLTQNNLFINNNNAYHRAAGNDYNGYDDGNSRSEANAQLNTPTSLFVDYANNDYRLTGHTDPGVTLAAEYNTDMFGNVRGADGTWDRGALQYVSGVAPTFGIVSINDASVYDGKTMVVDVTNAGTTKGPVTYGDRAQDTANVAWTNDTITVTDVDATDLEVGVAHSLKCYKPV